MKKLNGRDIWELIQNIIIENMYEVFSPFEINISKDIHYFYIFDVNNKNLSLNKLVDQYLNFVIEELYFTLYELRSKDGWQRFLKVNENVMTFFDFVWDADIDIMLNYKQVLENDDIEILYRKTYFGDKNYALSSLKKLGFHLPEYEIRVIFDEEFTFDDNKIQEEITNWIKENINWNNEEFEKDFQNFKDRIYENLNKQALIF